MGSAGGHLEREGCAEECLERGRCVGRARERWWWGEQMLVGFLHFCPGFVLLCIVALDFSLDDVADQ